MYTPCWLLPGCADTRFGTAPWIAGFTQLPRSDFLAVPSAPAESNSSDQEMAMLSLVRPRSEVLCCVTGMQRNDAGTVHRGDSVHHLEASRITNNDRFPGSQD